MLRSIGFRNKRDYLQSNPMKLVETPMLRRIYVIVQSYT